MGAVFTRAAKHKGTSFIEVLQNCIVFNDKAHEPIVGRENRAERMVFLEHGRPLVWGAEGRKKALRLKSFHPEVVPYDAAKEKEYFVHDETDPLPHATYLLTQLGPPDYPMPFGVFRAVEKPTYDEQLNGQVEDARRKMGSGDLKALIQGSETWTVK
jgi:2-oxoglutarate ferredoxin oxidoreductase subunit beta